MLKIRRFELFLFGLGLVNIAPIISETFPDVLWEGFTDLATTICFLLLFFGWIAVQFFKDHSLAYRLARYGAWWSGVVWSGVATAALVSFTGEPREIFSLSALSFGVSVISFGLWWHLRSNLLLSGVSLQTEV